MTGEELQNWVDHHLFTPSELASYPLCPFRFYAESILGLKELPETEPEMTPREIGILIHRILERFLREKNWSREKMEEDSHQIFDEFQKGRTGLSLPLFHRQKSKMDRALDAFLDQEILPLRKREGLIPEKIEWTFGKGETAPLLIKGQEGRPIKISGRIDRIDVDRKLKRFLVIDYKTGSNKTTGAAIERGESLQLPLYILAVQQLLFPDFEPVGGLYFHFSDMSVKEGILHTERIPPTFSIHPRSSTLIPPARWKPLFKKTAATVSKIVDSIRQGHFSPTPDHCDAFCPYQEVCRL